MQSSFLSFLPSSVPRAQFVRLALQRGLQRGLSVALGATLALAGAEVAAAQLGTNYCTANVNSTGVSSQIAASGSLDVGANDVTLACSDLPPSTFGFFVVSRTQAFVMNPGGSAGNVCLGNPIGRYSFAVLVASPAGDVSLPINLTSIPHPTVPFAIAPGETLNFQYWHRDDAVGGGTTSNFSNGLELTFSNAPPSPSFANDVFPLLDAPNSFGFSCSGCHGGTCGMDLTSAPVAYANLVNVAALCCAGETYVVPGNSAGSLLYQKLTAPQCGNIMPLVGTFPGDVNVIRDWIDAGAPNN